MSVHAFVVSRGFRGTKVKPQQTFVAQTPNDYKTLNSLNDEQHWTGGRARRRVRINTYEITQRDMQEINEPSRVTYDDVSRHRLEPEIEKRQRYVLNSLQHAT
jgi:hypothetical protein